MEFAHFKSFRITRVPELHFGPETYRHLPEILRGRNIRHVGIVTGGRSFRDSPRWRELVASFSDYHIELQDTAIAHEPDPASVNETADRFRAAGVEAVVAIGGGSAIDTGKAVSALVMLGGKVEQYLEGVGTISPDGRKVPFVAVPTTAGTGSEATSNAVISQVGEGGFKKSLRHNAYVPDVAIVDAYLGLGCPPSVTAASGLDAITQLLESYVATGASPFTDALAESGLKAAGRGFLPALEFSGSTVSTSNAIGSADQSGSSLPVEQQEHLDARSRMAYAAYLSGVCLTNAGLGIVHGISSSMGALLPIPHGVVCGSLLPGSVRLTVSLLRQTASRGNLSEQAAARSTLARYARAASLLRSSEEDGATGADSLSTVDDACEQLVAKLHGYLAESQLGKLAAWGVDEKSAEAIARGASGKSHPVALSYDDIYGLIVESL